MKFGIQMHLFRHQALTKGQTLKAIKRLTDMGWDGIELFDSREIPASEILLESYLENKVLSLPDKE